MSAIDRALTILFLCSLLLMFILMGLALILGPRYPHSRGMQRAFVVSFYIAGTVFAVSGIALIFRGVWRPRSFAD